MGQAMRTDFDFDQAIENYTRILAEHDLSPTLLWVFREDVTVHKRRIYVRWPLPAQNADLAKELYERGRDQGLGLRLDVFCLVDHRPCCYVYVPEDEVDASYAMLSALNMSVPTTPIHAKKVRSPWIWKSLLWLHSKTNLTGFKEELPQRL